MIGVKRRFAVANSPSNDTVENVTIEIQRVPWHYCRSIAVPLPTGNNGCTMVQLALNLPSRIWLGRWLCAALFSGVPTSLMACLIHAHLDVVDIVPISEAVLHASMRDLAVATHRAMHIAAVYNADLRNDLGRNESKGKALYCNPGDFVLAHDCVKPENASKRMSIWTEPW